MGSETPAVVSILERWSTHEPGRVAERTPRGRATATARSRPHAVSSSDAGSRASRSERTGWPVVSERPRSPRARSRTYSTNCSGRLLSRPSFTRISSTACWVAAGPAKNAAGSPGSARFKRNVTTTTPAMPGRAAASRRRTIRSRDDLIAGEAARLRASLLGERAEIQLAVEPVLVARHALLHRHVERGLHQRHLGDVGHRDARERAHGLRVLLGIALLMRGLDQLVHV